MTGNQPTLRESVVWAILLVVLYGTLGTYLGI